MLDLPIPFPFIQGDTLPAIEGVYETEDDNGNITVIDITGWTFTLVWLKADGTQVTKTAALDDAPNGKFSFHFATGDFDLPGSFKARITAKTPANDLQSWQDVVLAVAARVGT